MPDAASFNAGLLCPEGAGVARHDRRGVGAAMTDARTTFDDLLLLLSSPREVAAVLQYTEIHLTPVSGRRAEAKAGGPRGKGRRRWGRRGRGRVRRPNGAKREAIKRSPAIV